MVKHGAPNLAGAVKPPMFLNIYKNKLHIFLKR
jgi:hypothetical protein